MHAKLTALPYVSAFAFVCLCAASARAQNAPEGEHPIPKSIDAPTRALEIGVGTGWTQGYGNLRSGVDMRDVITPGIGVDLALMYRFDPHWAFGLAGQYQEFEAERATGARGVTAGLAAAYHVAPWARVDPWIQVGTGYRALWETHDAAAATTTQGLELAKLSLGLDFRVSRDVAVGPVIGADVSIPSVSDPRAATFVFAGAQAHFDVTSRHVPPPHRSETQITQARVTPPTRPVSPNISVQQEVIDACKLDLGDPSKAPKFAFDKSDLLPEDQAILDQLVQCLTTGALRNTNLVLTGRADPRGTIEYNDKLGMRRAGTIDGYFTAHGVGAERFDVETRGKRDATGTDEAGWTIDRRVDITLPQ
jgi:outer membrane protein OmpA-like peptidoglycan-associated protein